MLKPSNRVSRLKSYNELSVKDRAKIFAHRDERFQFRYFKYQGRILDLDNCVRFEEQTGFTAYTKEFPGKTLLINLKKDGVTVTEASS